MSKLWKLFLQNNGNISHKVPHYFPVYERHFDKFVDTQFVFWEIGVCEGGTLPIWKQYFGPFATIIGIDIDSRCHVHTNTDLDIHVRIGDQSDTKFLSAIIDEFGPPDAIVDDGSHVMSDVTKTFEYVYPTIPANGVYIVEDMCTAYWRGYEGGLQQSNTFIEKCKVLVDAVNGFSMQDPRYDTNSASVGTNLPDAFTRQTFSMCFYDAMVVFEKMKRPKGMITLKTGSDANCAP